MSAPNETAAGLRALEARVRRMESLLRGAESVLATIRYDGDLSHLPRDEHRRDSHRRAYDLIEFLGEQLEHWRASVAELNLAADDLVSIAERVEAR